MFKENQTRMPTTDLLIYSSSSYSEQMIDQIRTKIKLTFGLNLRGKEEQLLYEDSERKEIAAAVELIRNITRDDKVLLNYNAEFGFIRNLIGGLVFILGLIIILGIIFYIEDINLILISISFILGSILFIIALSLFKFRGRAYARQLFTSFLTHQ